MNKHTRRARETYSQVQGKLRSQKFTAAWQASRQRSQKLMAGRQSAREAAQSEIYGLQNPKFTAVGGCGIRNLRVVESDIYGWRGQDFPAWQAAESVICA